MNPDIKAKWVAALRSGDYKQGIGHLRGADGTYCCLGVLCELAAKEGVISPAKKMTYAGTPAEYYFSYEGHATWLPQAVAAWAELGSADPWIPDGMRLSYVNDVDESSFGEIADAIEKGL